MMATNEKGVPKEHNDLNKIEEAPPSWEEATAEHPQEGSTKKSFFRHFTITSKKDSSAKASSDFIINEGQTPGSPPQIEDGVGQNEEGEKVEEIPIVTCFRKFVNWLKLMSALATATCDLILMACGIGILVLGCFMHEKKFKLIRALITYKNQFRVMGETFIAFGVIYIVVFPLGLLGVLRHKRKLLKVHNIWLVLNLLAEGVVLYMMFRYLYKTDSLTEFKVTFDKMFENCGHNVDFTECCCAFKGIIPVKRSCWEYFTNRTMETITKEHSEDEIFYMRSNFFTDCVEHKDLYNRLKMWIHDAYFSYLPPLMILQAIALFFGWLVIKGIPENNPEDLTCSIESIVEVQKPKKTEKKKMNLFYKILLFFLVKRMFYFVFLLVGYLLIYIVKVYTQQICVKVPNVTTEISVWDILSNMFSFK